jgi:hypothetical protein
MALWYRYYSNRSARSTTHQNAPAMRHQVAKRLNLHEEQNENILLASQAGFMRGIGRKETEMSQPMPVHVPDDEEVEEVITACGGDAREAVRELLALKSHYERELDFASLALSYGFTRGWRPGKRLRE